MNNSIPFGAEGRALMWRVTRAGSNRMLLQYSAHPIPGSGQSGYSP